MPGIDPISSIAGLGLGLVGGIANLFGAGKANRQLGQLLQQDPKYTANPIAAQRMGLAQNLLNARMPGAASLQQNIYGSAANTMAGVNRNATDSSQALALGAASQAQQGQQFQQLNQAENQNYQQRYSNLAEAQQGQISEQEKEFQDQVRQFQDRAQITGAQVQNRANAWNSISNLGMAGLNFGLAGGFQNWNGLGKKKPGPLTEPPKDPGFSADAFGLHPR